MKYFSGFAVVLNRNTQPPFFFGAVLNIDHSFHWQKQPLIKYRELSPSILPSWEISENSILEM